MFFGLEDKSLFELLLLNGLKLHNALERRAGFDGFETVEETVTAKDGELFLFEIGKLSLVKNGQISHSSGPNGNFSKINFFLVNNKRPGNRSGRNFNKIDFCRCIGVLFLLEINGNDPSVVLGLSKVKELTAHFFDFAGEVEVALHFEEFLLLFFLFEALLLFEAFLLCFEGLLLLFGEFLLFFGLLFAVLFGGVLLDFFGLLDDRVFLLVLFADFVELGSC